MSLRDAGRVNGRERENYESTDAASVVLPDPGIIRVFRLVLFHLHHFIPLKA